MDNLERRGLETSLKLLQQKMNLLQEKTIIETDATIIFKYEREIEQIKEKIAQVKRELESDNIQEEIIIEEIIKEDEKEIEIDEEKEIKKIEAEAIIKEEEKIKIEEREKKEIVKDEKLEIMDITFLLRKLSKIKNYFYIIIFLLWIGLWYFWSEQISLVWSHLWTKDATPIYTRQLFSSKKNLQISAINYFRKNQENQNSHCVYLLCALLGDNDKDIKILAIEVLGIMQDKRAIKPLTDLLDNMTDSDKHIIEITITALIKIAENEEIGEANEYIGNILIRYLSSETPPIRSLSAKALGELEYIEALDDLLKLLDDKASEVRLASVEALGKLNQNPQNKVSRELSRVLLNEKEIEVRDAIKLVLQSLPNI